MAAERKQGDRTSFILGRETRATGSPITDRTKMVQRRYGVTSFNHDEASEKQQSDSLRSRRSDVFGEDGRLWGEGSIEMEIPTEAGFLDIIQPVLGDTAPESTAIPNKTLAAAGTNLSALVAANYFNLTTNVQVKVVDAQALTGTGEKTIAENLAAYADAHTLTVTPSSNATLANIATDAEIAITYEDADGESQTVTLTFANATKTTAQTAAVPAGARITAVEATGWNAGNLDITTPIAANVLRNPHPNHPGRLRFQFSAENAGGQIVVRGARRTGLASDETLPLKEVFHLSETANETTDITLSKYFHKIHTIEVTDSDGDAFTTGTVTLTSQPGGYETIVRLVDAIFPGLTIEAEVGGIPRLIRKAVPTGIDLNISNTVRATINLRSKRVDKRRTIEGGDDEQFISTAARYPAQFPFVTERFFPDWGGYVELDGDPVIFDSVTASINQNYEFGEGKSAGRLRQDLEPAGRRNVTVQIQTAYISGTDETDTFIRWDEKFRNNEPVSLKIATYHWLSNGRQFAIIWDMPHCEVTAPVKVEASGPGRIPITIALKAVPTPNSATSNEVTVHIFGDDQWA